MRIFIGGLLALLLSCSAMADEIPGSAFKYGQWVGGAYTDTTIGQFRHCSVFASYENGDRLYFFINRDGTITVALANPGFRLVKGEKFPVLLKVDRRPPFRGQAQALGSDFAVLVIEDFDRALTAFRKGFKVMIEAGNRRGVYDLTGTYQALDLARRCAREFFAYQQTPSAPAAPQTASTGVDKSMLYQIATGMIAEIGVRDFQFWTDEEVEKLNIGEGVFWNAPSVNLIGGVYVRPARENMELRETDAADLQEMTGACNGDILSGAREVKPSDHPTRELRMICSMDDLIQETIVSKVLIEDIVVYTLLLFSDLQAPTEQEEQNRRQMSEDVISRAASFIVPSE